MIKINTDFEQSLTSHFTNIDPDDLKIIASFFKPEIIKKNDFFLKSGKKSTKLSFIKSGLLRIFCETEKKEITQWVSTQGYFITDLSSFMSDIPARWDIQALTDTELYTIHRDDYEKLQNRIPRWYVLEKAFIIHCFATMETRIHNHLSMTAEERYIYFFKENPQLFNQIPLQYIASMLGMTSETFSRIRNKIATGNS
ncbi:cyclic nucleotide-binding domain protein [Chryseobacterium sp. StRB126]|uniref:Crp/Fnr family transcriptional regulator n=1 Tax=Chryseobacterium sp. StRB126 TaxID=878220 RepID=UPI0004E993E2|nr:Crp/Fnr family transcriptional regulator [Chryseobacterium sp. StRB126]BAP30601.1 cyclic nucleotide-binding domain protein [Chryseobacterium sp. StRB126]